MYNKTKKYSIFVLLDFSNNPEALLFSFLFFISDYLMTDTSLWPSEEQSISSNWIFIRTQITDLFRLPEGRPVTFKTLFWSESRQRQRWPHTLADLFTHFTAVKQDPEHLSHVAPWPWAGGRAAHVSSWQIALPDARLRTDESFRLRDS